MTNTFKEDFYEEEPVILESEVKDLKIFERNKPPGVDGIPIELLQATET